jgi:LPS sulfotransferase NodH
MQPSISYVVCSTARSGSTYFCAALRKTGVAGVPDEYFEQQHFSHWCDEWGVSSFADHVEKAIETATTPNGVCGIKTHKGGFLEYFIRNLLELPRYRGRGLSAPEVMGELFPNLHYIWLTRRDKVRQAVSLWRATETGQWVWSRQQPTASPRAYDFKRIDTNLLYIVRSEAEWQEYFTAAGVRPLTVVYEDFVCEYEETVGRVLRHLGVEPPAEPSPRPWMRKQADEESEQWVRRYREEKMRESR